jgi:type IV pilus assembly protein PilV
MSCKRNGFSLIEVMVSLVILVIGLIGIFNLHIISKQGSFESFQQTQASYYANDIINRMRLNRSQLSSYGTASGISYSGTSLTVPSKLCTGASLCSPAELKVWDVYDWQTEFIGSYEKYSGVNVGGLDTPVACIFVKPREVIVVFTWKGIRDMSTDSTGHSSEAISCGTSDKKRRVFEVKTAII